MPKYAALLFLVILSATLHARDDDPEPRPKSVKPREVAVPQSARLAGRGSYDAPVSIPSGRRLAELVTDKEARAAIAKQVDFGREKLVLFSWTGTSRDRLTPVKGAPGEAAFEYELGRAFDVAGHARLFAVPAHAKVKVTKARPRQPE
jgi:hypothetical protein